MTTDHPTTKEELLRRQRDGRAGWEALLVRVPIERVTERGVKGKLSIKDIVAHLAAWERHATERLHGHALGKELEPLPPTGMTWWEYEHAFNARVYELWRDRSWEEVRTEADRAYREFLAAADTLPEEVLFALEHPGWQTVAFNGYLHYLDFTDHVRAWLQELGIDPRKEIP